MNHELTPDEQKRRFAALCARLLGFEDNDGISTFPPLAVADDLAQLPGQPANDNATDEEP